ncbi:recombinase family protein [Allorhizocola rhizosphaerae]|uniref:recombinase family protein n=1 Tax=Allorhizocola rhizosphaerae TaxID=1872709 RepID=UPI003CCC5E00
MAVKAIFETFTKKRLGAKEVAKDLNQRGYRTRTGKRWSSHTVLAILRNRTYLGEIYYRGTWYRADDHHPALIDTAVFDHAQRILDQRSEDYSQRASANSDYCLTGEIKCDHCGAHYVGTAATGRNRRYRYYTCLTRQRYGPQSCPADRLPADEVEDKMLGALIDTYHQTDIIQEAIASIAAQAADAQHDRRKTITAIDTDLEEITAEIDRYLNAFENKAMTEAAAGERVAQLKERARQLKAHREELTLAAEDDPEPLDITQEDLTACAARSFNCSTKVHPEPRMPSSGRWSTRSRLPGGTTSSRTSASPQAIRTPDQGSGVRIVTRWAPPLGRKLNPSLVDYLRKCAARLGSEDLSTPCPPTASAYASPQRRALTTRLGSDDIDDLITAFRSGWSRPALAQRYKISISSVARILKRHRARDRDGYDPESSPTFRKSEAKILRNSRG